MANFCSACGAVVSQEARYCANCGSAVEDAQPREPEPSAPEPESEQSSQPPEPEPNPEPLQIDIEPELMLEESEDSEDRNSGHLRPLGVAIVTFCISLPVMGVYYGSIESGFWYGVAATLFYAIIKVIRRWLWRQGMFGTPTATPGYTIFCLAFSVAVLGTLVMGDIAMGLAEFVRSLVIAGLVGVVSWILAQFLGLRES